MTNAAYGNTAARGGFRETLRRSRVPGIARYLSIEVIGKSALVLLVLLILSALQLVFPLLWDNKLQAFAPSANAFFAVMLTFLLALWTAGRYSRYLLRQATPRAAVFAGSVVSLCAAALLILIGSLAVSALTSWAVAALSAVQPAAYEYVAYGTASATPLAALSGDLNAAFAALPGQCLMVAEYAALCYLVGCCMRRHPIWTLAVLLGVPFLVFLATLMPLFNEAMYMLEEAGRGNVNEAVVRFPDWLDTLIGIVRFIYKNFPLIRGIGALVSLPLSYWVMRGTPQP